MHCRPPPTGRPARLLVVLLLVVVLAACGSAPPAAERRDPAGQSGVPAPAAPQSPVPGPGPESVAADRAAGLHGALLQFRRDVPARRVQVRLTADDDGLIVEALELRTPRVPGTAAIPRGAALPADRPLDIPVVLGAMDCAGDPGPPAAEIHLRDRAGGSRTVTVPLEDDGLVGRLHGTECAEQALRAQAAIEVIHVGEVTGTEGPALLVTVELRRVAGADPVRVTDVTANTVYGIDAVGALPTLRDRPVTLQLSLVPARCDTHALGESYRTGLIGLRMALGDGSPRPFVLTPDDAVRRRLEAFAVETCRAREN